jgi:hypothetical protein
MRIVSEEVLQADVPGFVRVTEDIHLTTYHARYIAAVLVELHESAELRKERQPRLKLIQLDPVEAKKFDKRH